MEVCPCHLWNRGQATQLQVKQLFQNRRREYADESFRILRRGIQQEIKIAGVTRVSTLVEYDCQTAYHQKLHVGMGKRIDEICIAGKGSERRHMLGLLVSTDHVESLLCREPHTHN